MGKLRKKTKTNSRNEAGAGTKQVEFDEKCFSSGKYDESNPLWLPSKKPKKVKGEISSQKSKASGEKKFLTKKQRKKLEQIVERREKKSNRANLLEELQKYQLSSEKYQKLTPLVQIQTEGLKKLFAEIEKDARKDLGKEKLFSESEEESGGEDGFSQSIYENSQEDKKPAKPKSSVKGANKLKFRSWSGRFSAAAEESKQADPKVLGFDESSSSDDEEVDIKIKEELNLETDSQNLLVQNKTENKYFENTEDSTEDVIIEDVKTQTWTEEILLNGEDSVEFSGSDKEDNVSSESKSKKKKRKKSESVGEDNFEIAKKQKKSVKKKSEKKRKTSEAEEKGENGKESVDGANKATESKSPKKTFVPVYRTAEIEASRAKLPIIPEEQVIMEAISENLVTIIAGETGSGKTTQIPQFLYEAGYTLNGKKIGVTEPRRVAAIAMSSRVGTELNLSPELVSYQIRFQGNVSPKTQIKFMTDGVLLKEMEKEFLLSDYSAICIDEAHERSLYTDILIGLLSRCVLMRKKRQDPLKLIIMSATLRVEDFLDNRNLFKIPPALIHIPARQFPVQVHFNKHTPDNYLIAAYKKVVQIHRKLPPGGILVFVTGQQEVRTLVQKLQTLFSTKALSRQYELEHFDDSVIGQNGRQGEFNAKCDTNLKGSGKKGKSKKGGGGIVLRTFDLDKLTSLPLQSAENDDEEDEIEDDEDEEELDSGRSGWDVGGPGTSEPLHVLPLYSLLPHKEQQKVFEPAPEGSRLCVISTNVAETSLTIPSIRYVVDCGKVKQKVWDKLTGVQQFQISWESKASAEQRTGRAGRTGPGHCYRLFSSAVFDSDFPQYTLPEIQVRPVDDMILLMKSMAIDKVQRFPFPSAPSQQQLEAGEKILWSLGAVEKEEKQQLVGKGSSEIFSTISELGKTMAHFPVGPRFSKMLALSFQHDLIEFAITLVSALTVEEIFLSSSLHDSSKEVKSRWNVIRRKWAGTGSHLLLGDCMVMLKAVGAFEYDGGSTEFCQSMGIRQKAMIEIRKLRRQLTTEVNMLLPTEQEIPLNPKMKPPSEEQALLLRQIVLSGLPDRVGRKILESELKEGQDPKVYKHAYRCGELEDPVFIHESSVLRPVKPNWVVYQEIFDSGGKMYMRGLTAIDPLWIPKFCEKLCRFEEPLPDPPPFYDSVTGTIQCFVKATYGSQGWELPLVQMEHPVCLDKYKLFAKFLLQGEIFPKFAEWRSKLLSLPVTMCKSWARLQPRTQILLNGLTAGKVHTKAILLKKWEEEPKFLLQEFLHWIPEESKAEVSLGWPPLL